LAITQALTEFDMNDEVATVRLFSYGTLRQPEVQRAIFGREVAGRADALVGFAVEALTITDPAVVALSGKSEHRVLRRTGDPMDRIEGMIFDITEAELAAADAYEVDDYARVAARSANGVETFVYVLATEKE
jgi:hypothetical protein